MAETFDIVETARRIGQHAWIEQTLFAVVGRCATTVPESRLRARLASHSSQHAWHESLWRERMPTVDELRPDDLVAAPNDAVARFATALGEPDGDDVTIEKLVGVYRLALPRLFASYSSHQQHISELTDAPTARALKLALTDTLAQWHEGEQLVQSLLVSAEDVRRAAERQAALEVLLVEGGGFDGLST